MTKPRVMTKSLTEEQVRELLRAEVQRAGGQRNWAAAACVSQAYVSDVLNGRRDPGESIVRALRLRKVVRYEDAWDEHGKGRWNDDE